MDLRPGRKSKNRGDAMKGFERETLPDKNSKGGAPDEQMSLVYMQ